MKTTPFQYPKGSIKWVTDRHLEEKHRRFNGANRKHVLLITNHGCHSPAIYVTTDTGGQNFYVNDLAHSFVNLGYKVTILNRGGYYHPITAKLHKGIIYYDSVWDNVGAFCRLMYLEDGENRFISKEKLRRNNLLRECVFFFETAEKTGFDFRDIYFISSHYWDAGILGLHIQDVLEKRYGVKTPHVWTPHSLGILKRENYVREPRRKVKSFNFPSRIRDEERVISMADGVVSTSNVIRKIFDRYRSKPRNHLRFPPGIDKSYYRPRKIERCNRILAVLMKLLGLSREDVIGLLKAKVVFLEVSRTAATKQKDVLLKAFSRMENRDEALLIMTIDHEAGVYDYILDVYDKLKNKDHIILIGKVLAEKEMAELFSLADVYITASVMEGWGMSVQEAAASRCAVISSKYVPFVNEVLKEHAIVVEKQNAKHYSKTIDLLVKNTRLRNELADKIHRLVTKHYSWNALTRKFIQDMEEKRIIR